MSGSGLGLSFGLSYSMIIISH